MSKYLDPKADVTFKKVFGEHKDLLISLLNALLPLPEDAQIESIEYLPTELVPKTPLLKNTIVDVRCSDVNGRTFIVEMQMIWEAYFLKRVLFNSSKSYIRQLKKGETYNDLKPVYALSLVNDEFRKDTDDFYHEYKICDTKNQDQTIDDMCFIFIELPKFKAHTFVERRMAVLWLKYLTEINEQTKNAPEDLLANNDTRKALDIVEESAYTEAQMNAYNHFWDVVSTERSFIDSALKRGMKQGFEQGMEKGIEQGMAKGMAKGIEKGKAEGRLENARKLLAVGVSAENIAKATGLTIDEIKSMSN